MKPETSIKWQTKPTEIEAMQVLGGAENATPIVDWVLEADGTASWSEGYDAFEEGDDFLPAQPENIKIKISGGVDRAFVGDWIVKDKDGFHVCPDSVFSITYVPVQKAFKEGEGLFR